MGKQEQNSAVEQVMEELNEELSAVLNVGTELLSPALMEDTSLSQEPVEPTDNLVIQEKPEDLAPSEDQSDSEEEPVSPKKPLKKSGPALQEDSVLSEEESLKEELGNMLSFEPGTANKKRLISDPLMEGVMSKLTGRYKSPSEQNMAITLKQSENLRVAQDRIVALETEIDRFRKENEELIATGDIFRERLDKVAVQNDNLKRTYEESREEFQEEKKTLLDTLNDQGREMDKLALKNKELEKRLSNNILQIRVRERELENRLELMKLDSQTLIREKDQYILDLKRQMDRIKMDLETQKNKYNETQEKLKGQSHQTRRATRGLQMALHILKGNAFSSEDREKEQENKPN